MVFQILQFSAPARGLTLNDEERQQDRDIPHERYQVNIVLSSVVVEFRVCNVFFSINVRESCLSKIGASLANVGKRKYSHSTGDPSYRGSNYLTVFYFLAHFINC